MKNWLCKPTSLEDTKEIIERAVANGAEYDEYTEDGDCVGKKLFQWDFCDAWGVSSGKTFTIDWRQAISGEYELLTIDQVRDQFPLLHEKNNNMKTEPNWNEKPEGATHWDEREGLWCNQDGYWMKGDFCRSFQLGWGSKRFIEIPTIDQQLTDPVIKESLTAEEAVCSEMEPANWNEAPEWAIYYGYIGISKSPIWANDEWYQYLSTGRRYFFGKGSSYSRATLDVVENKPEAITWNGQGFPPVETVCEAEYDVDKWVKIKVLAHKNNGSFQVAAVEVLEDSPVCDAIDGNLFWAVDFRPLKTERERWVESTLIACEDKETLKKYLIQFYDAIISDQPKGV